MTSGRLRWSVATVLAAMLAPAVVSAGPSGGALPPALAVVLDVASLDEVPDDADMVAVNITATRAAGKGYFTAYACDEDLPLASNVNYLADDTVPNLALVSTSAEGTICIATSEVSDLVVDVIGYVPLGSDIRPLAAPFRITDTRPDDVPAAGDVLQIPITAPDGPFDTDVWPDLDLVLANVTAISRGGTGFVTVSPCTPGDPTTSSVNYGPGQTKANFVISRLSDDGGLCVYTSEPADVIVDIAAVAGDGITPLPTPVRLVDTRDTTTVTDRLQLDITGRTDVPDTATAAVYNLTAARASDRGFATSHPCLTTAPTASNLNYTPGPPVANGTITKLSDTGHLCIDVSTPTDLIVDLIAYTTDTTHYVPITPTRSVDTRQGWETTCDKAIVGPGNTSAGNAPHRELDLIDLRTGDRRTIPGTTDQSRDRVVLSADCSAIYQLSEIVPQKPDRIERISLATGAMTVVRSARPGEMFASIKALDDGRVIVWTRDLSNYPVGNIIDAHSGETLVEFGDLMAAAPAAWPDVDTALHYLIYVEDGSLLLWDLVDLELLYVDGTDADYRLSPDGSYIARSRTKDGWRVCEILTRYGDLVDEFQIAPFASVGSVRCDWAAPGVLWANSANATTLRHQLFGPTAPLTRFPGDPVTPWVVDYR